MDFSERYIKMCEQARELQEGWKPQKGDWYYAEGGEGEFSVDTYTDEPAVWKGRIFLVGNNYRDGYEHPDEYLSADKRAWLPRQDQLLEMWLKWRTVPFPIILVHLKFFWEEGPYWDKIYTFASMEQFLLAFVMWQLYCKVWDEDKEDWVKLEECDD